MRTLILLLLSFSNICLASNSYVLNTKNFSMNLMVFDKYQVLELRGSILFGDFNRAMPLLKKIEKNKNLVLNLGGFNGGYVYDIAPISKLLKDFCKVGECLIETYLGKNQRCSSYCLLLYMIGDSRIAHEESFFGFHAAWFGPLKSGFVMRFNYKNYGVDEDWLKANRSYFTSKTRMTYKSPNEIEGSNIVTHILKSDLDLLNL